jgi:hypothetical protein
MDSIRGIYKDKDFSKHPQGYMFDIRNGVIWRGVLQNEEGTELHSDALSSMELNPIGILPVGHGDKVYFSIHSSGLSEIGVLSKDGVYTQRLREDLGFNVDFPIDAEAQYNYKGELVVAFTDGLNTPKIINLDDIVQPFDLNHIELFPTFEEPKIEANVSFGDGSLLTGVYYVFIRYKNHDNTITHSSRLSNPIPITSIEESTSYDDSEGSPAGRISNQGIKVYIPNPDLRFKSIVVGIISKIEGVVDVFQLTEQPLNGTDFTYLISNTNEAIDLTIEEVIVDPIFYKTIKHLSQVSGALYGASITEWEPDNLQSFVNQIVLGWESYLTTPLSDREESYKVTPRNVRNRPFLHGEVYAFNIRFKYKRKGWSRYFHIPGRPAKAIGPRPLPSDVNIVGREDDLISTLSSSYPFLQDDARISSEGKFFHTRDTASVLGVATHPDFDESGYFGEFGYWENKDEVYPDDPDTWGSLAGQRVRHHRFPSKLRMAYNYSFRTAPPNKIYGINMLDALGLRVISMPTLPSVIDDEIEGWEISYSERSSSNSTVVGTDNITYGALRRDANNTLTEETSSGGNYHIEDWLSATRYQIQLNKLRLHSFDLLYDRSSPLPNYIENDVLYTISNQLIPGTTDRYRFIGRYLEPNNINTSEYTTEGTDFSVIRYNSNTPLSLSFATQSTRIRSITNVRYIPSNVKASNINNRGSEEFVAADINSPNLSLGISTPTVSIPYPFGDLEYQRRRQASVDSSMMTTLKVFRSNVYFKFNEQKQVATGFYFKAGETATTIFGGDGFIGEYSYITTALVLNTEALLFDPLLELRYRYLRSFLVSSRHNVSLRHEDPTLPGSRYYPKSKLQGNDTWFLNKDDASLNIIAYNKDYTSVNNLKIGSFIKEEEEFSLEDQHKIIRSLVSNPEERAPSWRTFKANDYFIIPRNRGVITNIKGIGLNLFINTETSLFITTGSEVLATNEAEVAVGTGDIFARPPRELIEDDLGYTGCQHKFSCILTPVGYFFIDQEKKNVFVSDGRTVKTINPGLNDFFRDNLTPEIDNPLNSTGYTVAWDEKYGRIIFSKQGDNPFTVSYTPALESWTSFHDYIPRYLYNDRDELFGLLGERIDRFNAENYGSYFGEEIKPFHIVGVINERDDLAKLLKRITWNTIVKLTDDTFLRNVTFHEALVWNRYQCTGVTELTPSFSDKGLVENFESAVIRRAKDNWNFNRLRDNVVDNSLPFIQDLNEVASNIDPNRGIEYKKRLIDTFFLYKLLFDNQKISNLNGQELSPKISLSHVEWDLQIVKR